MRNKNVVSIMLALIAVLVAGSAALALMPSEADLAKEEIVSLVEAAYINGAFNAQDTESMRKGFHPVFKIHGVRDGAISQYPIEEWASAIDKRKSSPEYEQETWKHKFPIVDITGEAAIVKVELFKVEDSGPEHVYTDYLSLLKFDTGWKITDKVYHRH